MGDMADLCTEQGMDMWAAHQSGHCHEMCQYCGEQKQMQPHWYTITRCICPVCGDVEVERTRMYTRKPKDEQERHLNVTDYCGCEGYLL